MSRISHIRFDNENLRELPIDPKPFEKEESRQVPNAIFAKTTVQPVKAPKVVSYSKDALKLIGVDVNAYAHESELESEIAMFLGGNSAIPDSGCEPHAHCYCGHQFGSFAGQLGDGASMYLGEVLLESHGEHADNWGGFRTDVVELTLKGAGKTPFSRNSDGRKVLRSSIREFLASEAMHYLGIPTTRSASCVTSASTVQRDPYYDGRVINEQCAVITRIAPSFFRFGSFEIFKTKAGTSSFDRAGPSAGNELLKKRLLDRVVSFFPASVSSVGDDRARYQAYLLESVRLTAELAAKWDAFGFVHGVLNTDNMSVLGLTIDYGPYAFMEYFDPDFTPNGSDSSGRYTYERQAGATKWNLHKLAEMLESLLDEDAKAFRGKDIVDANFDRYYKGEYYRLLRGKLGLLTQQPGDEALISEFFSTLARCNTDFTDSFQAIVIYHENLADAPADSVVSSRSAAADALVDRLTERSAAPTEVISALKRKTRIHRLSMHPQQISGLWDMLETSPDEVQEMFGGAPIEAVRDEISGEKAKLDRLVHCSAETKRLENTSPTTKAASDRQRWEAWVERYIARIALDDSLQASTQIELIALQRRVDMMRKHNPTFVLRNWIMQDAIQAAESGDFSQVRTLTEMIKTPFAKKFSSFATGPCKTPPPSAGAAAGGLSPGRSAISAEERKFISKPPVWAPSVLCTCSS